MQKCSVLSEWQQICTCFYHTRLSYKTKNILSLNNLNIPLDYKKAPFIYWWVIFSTGDSVTDWFTNKNKLSFHPFFNEYIGRFTRWFYKSINQPWACIKKFFNKHSWHKLIKVTLILQKERGFCLITHGLTKILLFFIRKILETCGPGNWKKVDLKIIYFEV